MGENQNWFSFILQEGAAELAARREIERIEAEARTESAGNTVDISNALKNLSGNNGWVMPAVIAGAAVLIYLVAVK